MKTPEQIEADIEKLRNHASAAAGGNLIHKENKDRYYLLTTAKMLVDSGLSENSLKQAYKIKETEIKDIEDRAEKKYGHLSDTSYINKYRKKLDYPEKKKYLAVLDYILS